MSDTVIKVEDLSKQYRLGQVSTGTLSHDINRWWHTIRGKEDPYLKIGEANDRTTTGNSDYVWALQDINFEVKQGEVLGIIGRNGAGKSTLLKILSRTTAPTTGSIKIKGRVASLLEVGTGFHPELSGRENIYLNGAILGMTRNEIKRKFDEIVAFAGVERYIDTPVKRYSSGMYVRLAFAVAAHLEPEILIVDEVLAVGDAEFQKKCLGKMKDVSVKEGRTVLFVSHNMVAVKQLCNHGLLLKNGTLFLDDDIDSVIGVYQGLGSAIDNVETPYSQIGKLVNGRVVINEITINGRNSGPIALNHENNFLSVHFNLECKEDCFISIEAKIRDEAGIPLASFSTAQKNAEVQLYEKGQHELKEMIRLPEGIMKGTYIFSLYLTHPGYEFHFMIEDKIIIDHEGCPTATGNTLEYKDGNGWFLLS